MQLGEGSDRQEKELASALKTVSAKVFG